MGQDKPETTNGKSRAGRTWIWVIRLALAIGFVYAALALPNDIARIAEAPFLPPPVELAVLVAVLAAVPSFLIGFARLVGALLVAGIAVLKLADMAAYQALARPFNPVLDLHLLGAAWNLLSGAAGPSMAAIAVIAALAVAFLAVWASYAALGVIARAARRHRLAAGSVAALLAGAAVLVPGLGSTASTRLAVAHVTDLGRSLRELEEFERAAVLDPIARIEDEALLSTIEGRDVLLFFVESYGRTVLADPDYSRHVLPVLQEFDRVVEGKGLTAASGFLKSPVAGGQSWLAHASVLSGLWVDSQRRYNALLVSDRSTLVTDFRRAGWRSVAVMPAITMAWPEGEALGYDAIYDEDALGYRGKPFNWVTMPDQYTLSAFDRLERQREDRPPLFAEVALISSHAPWTPIPHVIDWEEVGDGSVFDRQATSGASPREVWSDMDRVRVQFRRSIEYALANLGSYVEERLDDDFLLVILGDHQPARAITGPTENRDVPVHVISDDPALVAELADALGLNPGMIPSSGATSMPMDDFRETFLRALSGYPSDGTDGGPTELGPT